MKNIRHVEDGMGFKGLVPSAQEKQNENVEFRVACEIVERHCRALGGDVEVIFLKRGVQIARTSDSGCSVCSTLYATLKEIEKYED